MFIVKLTELCSLLRSITNTFGARSYAWKLLNPIFVEGIVLGRLLFARSDRSLAVLDPNLYYNAAPTLYVSSSCGTYVRMLCLGDRPLQQRMRSFDVCFIVGGVVHFGGATEQIHIGNPGQLTF